MVSRINGSKRISIVTLVMLVMLLAGACGPILPEQGRDETATSAPTLTQVLPTVTHTSTPEVVYVTDIPTPLPTPQPPPIFTPDAVQLERWQEYQTELAKVLLYGYGPDSSKNSLCEWDILGRSGQEVYVWAYCATSGSGSGSGPAVIYLEADESIQEVSTNSSLVRKFPTNVLEKIHLYYTPTYPYQGRPEELRLHLHYRRDHPDESPLVVVSVMSTATPTP